MALQELSGLSAPVFSRFMLALFCACGASPEDVRMKGPHFCFLSVHATCRHLPLAIQPIQGPAMLEDLMSVCTLLRSLCPDKMDICENLTYCLALSKTVATSLSAIRDDGTFLVPSDLPDSLSFFHDEDVEPRPIILRLYLMAAQSQHMEFTLRMKLDQVNASIGVLKKITKNIHTDGEEAAGMSLRRMTAWPAMSA